MSVSVNEGIIIGALAEDAEVVNGNMVKLTVHCSRYVRDAGEKYDPEMVVYVKPYTKGKNQGSPLDVGPFTKGKPVLLKYSLAPDRNGNAMPIVVPSNAHLNYSCILDGSRGTNPAEALEDDDSDSGCPF